MTVSKEYLRTLIAIEGVDTHQSGNFAELLQPKFNKVFYETFDEVSPQFDKIFKVGNSKKNKEYDFYMGAMSNWSKFGTSNDTIYSGADDMPVINNQKLEKGVEIVYNHEEFADGFKIQRKFIDDEQYGVIEKMTADLARAGRSKVETDCAGYLEGQLARTDAGLKGYNADWLFSTAHTTVSSNYTYSNLLRTKLSPTALKQAISQMRRIKDEAGKVIIFTPDTLIVAPELEFEAYEILKSKQLANTELNNYNSLENKLKVVVYDYLSGSGVWFLQDSKRHELKFYWRTKPQFDKEKDFDSMVHKWSGYMRYSMGYSSTRGIIGSTGELNAAQELTVYQLGSKATATLALTGVGVDGEKVTINGVNYEIDTNSTFTAGNIQVVPATTAIDDVGIALAAEINAHDDKVNAAYDATANKLVLVAKITGANGNSIAVSENFTNGAFDGGVTALFGGTDPS